MAKLRTLFLGNHVPTLQALLGDERVELAGIVCEAARAPDELVTCALVSGVELVLVERKAALLEALQGAGAIELAFMCSFGWILEAAHLAVASQAVVNVHYSLLPEFRGRHAINRALQTGARVSGVTAHYVDAGIDTGAIIAQARVAILPLDTDQTLYERITAQVPGVVAQALKAIVERPGQGERPSSPGSYFPPFDYETECRVDWSVGAVAVYNLVRSQTGFRGAWTLLRGERIHFREARLHSLAREPGASAGTVLEADGRNRLLVAAGGTHALWLSVKEPLREGAVGLRLG